MLKRFACFLKVMYLIVENGFTVQKKVRVLLFFVILQRHSLQDFLFVVLFEAYCGIVFKKESKV